MLIGLITVAYVSYYYEKRLLQSKNVTSAHDYAIFLKGGQEEIYNLNKEIEDEYKHGKYTLKCGSMVSVATSKRGEVSEKKPFALFTYITNQSSPNRHSSMTY